MNTKPWDARIAYQLAILCKDSQLSPNHFTTLRLVVGLVSTYAFAQGDSPNLAALLLALSNWLDHLDGEYARLTQRMSRFGHIYDLCCDAVIHVLLFVCIGIGLSDSNLGNWAIMLGITAGIAVATIFHLRNEIESSLGKSAVRQASFAGFECEDVLYLLPLVTLANGLPYFLIAAGICAPLAMLLVLRQYWRLRPNFTVGNIS